ncbi:MAG TPA: GIY-YIG nuclease family protein [Thermoanaerobaculia bacterium]|jgi:putative endonuclease|nr:GIY-YIG nuclease family protein [Thermoanaerobaculia bacterium]
MELKVHQYAVYMMTNRWKNVLYTGVTSSLEKRVWQHKSGSIPGFTKKYNCDRLVFFEISDRVETAIAREKQIKGWTRAKKNALIATMNPEWKDLAEEWYRNTPRGSFAVYAAQDDKKGTP